MATPEVTTELNAVNSMLLAIGETPVNSLTGLNIVTVTSARAVLAEVSRKVQVMGWHFNTDEDYPLTPDETGIITIPSTMVKVDLNEDLYRNKYDAVVRTGKLYDKLNHTFTWTESVKANVTWLFDFDELPEVARQYIMVRAVRLHASRTVGSETIDGFTQDDETRAWVTLKDEEANTANYNIFDNVDVIQPLIR